MNTALLSLFKQPAIVQQPEPSVSHKLMDKPSPWQKSKPVALMVLEFLKATDIEMSAEDIAEEIGATTQSVRNTILPLKTAGVVTSIVKSRVHYYRMNKAA